ncbi:uncharacterized protein M6B38_204245 [Iris pallida]|uniref:Uncharacterized protein n=1 Tax=Iris pallida TaxID=29817 RepID=A0AAX6E7M6_IRIPA|nr:uncharacterized protein M6B38_111815 [Iris pallida]KAJ6799923.1 uncharacterized protein M6B38_204245 [Iris pallida]
MDYENYTAPAGRRWRRRPPKGFRLKCHRFYVHRLRARLLAIFRLVCRCFKLLTEAPSARRSGSSRRKGLILRVGRQTEYKTTTSSSRACMRSNSFYAEAIADCLDFIKRNSSSSVDDTVDEVRHAGEES